jgi:hypothetical protein
VLHNRWSLATFEEGEKNVQIKIRSQAQELLAHI